MYQNNLKISGMILLVLFMLFGSACQKTPENIRKVDESHNKNSMETASQISSTWNEEIKEKNLTVIIDSEINVLELKEFSTWNYKNFPITQDVVTKYLEYFSKGNTIYDAFEGMTKEQIQTNIKATSEKLENTEEVKNSGISQQEYEEWLEEEKQFLTYLINEYEKAPSETELIISDGLLKSKGLSEQDIASDRAFLKEQGWDDEKINKAIDEQKSISQKEKEINCIVNLGKKSYAKINAYNYSPNNQGISYYNTDVGSVVLGINELDDSNVKINIDKSKAKEQANTLLEDLEIKNMQNETCGYFIIPQLDGTQKYGYAFLYTKKAEDLNVSYAKINPVEVFATTQELVSEPCFDEELLIGVDETGVIAFEWKYPKQLGEKVSNDIKLLPFDKINEVFAKQIIAENVWNDNEIESKTIYIDRVKLGFVKIKNENSDDFLLVPAWDFYGHYKEKYSENSQYYENEQNSELIYKQYGHSFVTLNAIDGSRIDRLRGY